MSGIRNVQVKYHCSLSPSRSGLRMSLPIRLANADALSSSFLYQSLRLNFSDPT